MTLFFYVKDPDHMCRMGSRHFSRMLCILIKFDKLDQLKTLIDLIDDCGTRPPDLLKYLEMEAVHNPTMAKAAVKALEKYDISPSPALKAATLSVLSM